MIIIPGVPVGNNDPELLPVSVIVETRLDIIVVILRVLRYFGSVGAYGPTLIWKDSADSPLFINKAGEDPYDSANHLPSMTVDIGGYRVPDNQFLFSNAVNTSQKGTDFYSELNTSVQILIKARSDVETYTLADKTANYLKVLTPDILSAVENLEGIFSITAGKVVPTQDESSVPGKFECMVTLGVKAQTYLNWSRYKGPGGGPDPTLNTGVHFGVAGIQSRLNPNGSKPLFSYGSFITLAGDEDTGGFTVTRQMLFSGRKDMEGEEISDTATRISLSVKELDLGDVPPDEGTGELGISLTAQGEDDLEIELPAFVEVDLPGFDVVHKGNPIIKLRK